MNTKNVHVIHTNINRHKIRMINSSYIHTHTTCILTNVCNIYSIEDRSLLPPVNSICHRISISLSLYNVYILQIVLY